MDVSALQVIVDYERFIVEVRALTGWSEASANRLDRRLGKIARISISASHQQYRNEWRRRYISGWKYAKWPHSMARFVR